MPVLPMGGALLGIAGMSDDNIIHFNPWRDFNDAAPLDDPFAMSRIDTATLRQATEDVRAFGVVVSELGKPIRSNGRTTPSPGSG
jgi:hypothetical protein